MGYDIPKDHHGSAPSDSSYTGSGPAPSQDFKPASELLAARVNEMIAKLHSAAGDPGRGWSGPRATDRALMIEASRLISVLSWHVGKNPSYWDCDRLLTVARRLAVAGATGADLSPGDPLCHEAAKEIFEALRPAAVEPLWQMSRNAAPEPEPAPAPQTAEFTAYDFDHPTCHTCVHFCQQGDSYGQCRRYAPVVSTSANSAAPVWPFMLFSEWCGEYEPKEEDQS